MDTAKLKKFAQYARKYLIGEAAKKIKIVLGEGSLCRRENPQAVSELEKQIKQSSESEVAEKAAYIWFNRFCALRFMDINRYTPIGIVSPAEGLTQPEILAEAKSGHIDEDLIDDKTRQKVFGFLNGSLPGHNPQNEAYQLLVIAACNYYNKIMPFLFEKISDYTEILIPDDMLSDSSILSCTREALTAEECRDVEVIGWLYQFYISEKKDMVFEGLKKNKKVTPENIPAATQLFTPNWIVRYLVENSLGRLWMLNKPNSKLADKMEYFVDSGQLAGNNGDYLKVSSPEEIKVCDPACGSGHLLVYAFELLYHIYEEEGYDPNEIPEKILKNNLYGIEIDERAGELAAFALTMKARGRHKRFFSRQIQPNICVLKNIDITPDEISAFMDAAGRDLFTANIQELLGQFKNAGNFGSLIRPAETDVNYLIKLLNEKKSLAEDLFLQKINDRIKQALTQADYLSPKYHVVVANPPYMGGKGMNDELKSFVQKNYPDSKSDLFAAFIERGFEIIKNNGYSAMVTMQSWMFLSSFENLRKYLINEVTIECMVHMANMVMGIAFGTAATVWNKSKKLSYKGHFSFVNYSDLNEENKPKKFPVQNERLKCVSSDDFKKIPGSPIAYWTSPEILNFFNNKQISDIAETRLGMATADNDKFLRLWHEISELNFGRKINSRQEALNSRLKWFPYQKGGNFKKWYGNLEYLVNWKNDGEEIQNFINPITKKVRSHNYNLDYIFKPGVTWNALTSSKTSARLSNNSLFDNAGSSLFTKNNKINELITAYLNCNIIISIIKYISPTLNYQPGDIAKLPINLEFKKSTFITNNVNTLVILSQSDWDSYENSWDFKRLPLLTADSLNENIIFEQNDITSNDSAQSSASNANNPLPTPLTQTLESAYTKLRKYWKKMTIEMKKLEEENNKIFIEAYGLQDELTPEVPLNEITLTCNPYYRYGKIAGDSTDSTDENAGENLPFDENNFAAAADAQNEYPFSQELEDRLLSDTIKEFISYAAGCMFGRYSLDKPGLILANQGETLEDYLEHVPDPKFTADDDNVIPILDGEWFTDDITERFYKFLKVTFGESNFTANLKFIENALGKDIRKYFIKDFYNDHVKRYKKRPIYWLFSSPNGSFNALIYMHRYRPDTVSVILNNYLREFRLKLTSKNTDYERISISGDASASEKARALKEIEKIKKILNELDKYERETLYPLASNRISIDLDDGVKVNYQKFGAALKKIPGLDKSEE
ncbi:MAG: BREX-1 system adenine-specific DNA-methyltransferase PglX [Candidatus Wallbacteria bacterium]